MADIYLLIEGKQEGPYTEEDVRQYLADGRFQNDQLAWREGLTDWAALSEVAYGITVPVLKPVKKVIRWWI